MAYKGIPLGRKRRYLHSGTYASNEVENPGNSGLVIPKTIERIPLPNEIEAFPENSNEQRSSGLLSIFNTLKKRIGIEEIILLGLIFILLEEGIDDEFLLILLVYVFLF